MTTPPLTPDDRDRLAQIDALITDGTPSADPAANWLQRQRPPIDPTHYDQLRKEILTMNIDDLMPKRKKRPVRVMPRLLKLAAALALLAGAYVAYLATRPVPYYTIVPSLSVEMQATFMVAEATAAAQQMFMLTTEPLFIQPTPLPPPIAGALEATSLPMAVTVPAARARMFDGQPLALQAGQRVALYLRAAKDDDETIFIKLTENALVLSQIAPDHGYELLVENNIGLILGQLVSPDLLSEALLYVMVLP
ncbi:MAG: hypothetical protein SNJ80_15405 [Anaerolinea sp.]